MSGFFNIRIQAACWLFLLMLGFAPGSLNGQVLKTLSTNDTTYQYTDAKFELLSAASEGDTAKIQAFLAIGTPVNTTTWDGVSPLMYAAQNGHLHSVEILLHHGANVHMKPLSQIDALTGACISGHAFIADTLILNGADVNSRNNDGMTPLMWAAAYNHDLVADVLIFYHAKINTADEYGNTALHFSCFYDSPETTRLLLDHGAKADTTDINGFTPLMIAAQNSHMRNLEILISHGAAINKTNAFHMNALALAIVARRDEAAEFLLKNNADPNITLSKNINIRDLSILSGDKYMAAVLDSAGVAPSKKILIHQWGIHALMDFNAKDMMLGGSVSISEARYGLELEAGFRARPSVRSTRYEKDTQQFYQFWEKRAVTHLSVEKNIPLVYFDFKQKLNAFGGLGLAYTYGSFRGSSRKPDDQLLLIPVVGIEYQYDQLSIKLNYEYFKLKASKIPASRIELRMGIHINRYRKNFYLKEEPIE